MISAVLMVRWQQLEDTALMAELCAGRVEAFGALYDRYCDRAYRVAISVCRDDHHAQDAVQEAFLSVWRNRASYDPKRGTVAAWLLSSVRHRAIDLVRRNDRHAVRRASEDHLEQIQALGDVPENVIQRNEAERVTASLSDLPGAQQEVIILAYFGGLTHTEIAAHLGLPPGTVKGRMRLGLHKLRSTAKPQVA